MNKIKNTALLFIMIISLFSCSEADLTAVSTNVITADRVKELGAESPEALKQITQPLVTGLYSWLTNFNSLGSGPQHNDYGITQVFLTTDLMNTDMYQNSSQYGWYYQEYQLENRKNARGNGTFIHWNYFYKLIKSCNDILENLDEDLKDKELIHFRGQALAMRAYAYFYLIQLYQHTYKGHEDALGVPIVTEKTTGEQMANNPRAKVSAVYDLILKDLKQSEIDLEEFTRDLKTQLNKQIVQGLLARVYLTMEDYENAATMAHQARQGFTLMDGEEFFNGFKDLENKEWMWGSHLTLEDAIVKTGIINWSSHLSSLSYGYAIAGNMQKCIDKRLYDAIPVTDTRKKGFAYNPSKNSTTIKLYPKTTVVVPNYANVKFGRKDETNSNNVDYVYMRAAEMYLIEAEALAALNKSGEAQDILFQLVEKRDPSYKKSSSTGNILIEEIYLQRRIELWGEGFSFFDHKRLKKEIVRNYPGTNHPADARFNFPAEDKAFRFRIPEREIENNTGITPADNND